VKHEVSERLLVFLIGAVQFVNILDFVMVMPLGPDFARVLGIPLSQLGLVGGSYTLAAAAAGLLGSLFLDRFDRRTALAVAMAGLAVGTFAGGLATGLPSLLGARVLAGLFGGPATSLSLSIVADAVPAQRRGKALGAVMGALSAAVVLGVPSSLKLAEWAGWRAPFFAVAVLGLLITVGTIALLPPMRGHLTASAMDAVIGRTRAPLFRRTVVLSYLMTAVTMGAGFLVLPNLSAYLQVNLGLPRSQLPLLYGIGGVVSFICLRAVGLLVDRLGSFRVGTAGSALMFVAVWLFFIDVPTHAPAWMQLGIRVPGATPVLLLFLFLFLALSTRNVAYSTLTSKVPGPTERARFMSFQSAVQHLASAAGAIASSLVLAEAPDGRLLHVRRLAVLSLGLTAALPALLWAVERAVDRSAVVTPPPSPRFVGPPDGIAPPLKKV
jgi:predicted MFS family arabinose efflux permease